MTGVDVVNVLIPKLLDMGIIVHRYNAYSTSSIYLKLDFGLTCGIRIADHPGKKKYSYRFNIIKDYVGDRKVIAHVSGGYRAACEEYLDNVVYTCTDGNTRSNKSLENLKIAVKKADKVSQSKHRIHDLQSIARYQFNTKKADKIIPENTQTRGRFNTRILVDKTQIATLHFETGLYTLNLPAGKILKEEKINRVFINFDLQSNTLFTPGIDDADENIIPNDEVVIINNDEVVGVGKSTMSGKELVESTKGVGVKIRHQIK